MAHEGDRISKISGETTVEPYIFRNFVTSEAGDEGNILNSDLDFKGWGQSAKLGTHSAICSKLGTALQAYTLNPCTKFPPNPTSRKVNT